MDFLLEKIPVLIFVFVVVAQIMKAVAKARTTQQEHGKQSDETTEQRRVREIQERIRRAIASRGGQDAGGRVAPPNLAPPPVLHPVQTSEDSDENPFHDRREPPALPLPDPMVSVRAARNRELERQADLAEKLQAVNEARELARHRAAQETSEAMRLDTPTVARRHGLVDVIRNHENLRSAVLLREILGPPVGLR